jgi:NitT/TauT family transport system ATP-binding protein
MQEDTGITTIIREPIRVWANSSPWHCVSRKGFQMARLAVATKGNSAGVEQPAERLAAVRLNAVKIAFKMPGGEDFPAVDATDLIVGEEEFVAIVGPTGCGKSTLLNVAAGLLRPSSGSVHVFGQNLAGINEAAGYLFQQDALMPWKTAVDNVAIGLEVAGVRVRDARERARSWLGRVGLAEFGERYPHTLSGGQRKRVALAQILIRDPKILLMDEPFGPLDAQTRLIMCELLLRLWSDDRKAVMFVTHDLEEAIALADRVVIMSAGPSARIIGDFTIPLQRPRDVTEIKVDPRFQEVHREIWHLLKKEVLKGYPEFAEGAGA